VIDRRVRRAPRVAVAALADGAVASLRGTARAAGPPLVAPLSRAPCIYYELEVQAFDRRSVMWVTVHLAMRGHAFFLADETGSALVEPGCWRISVERDAPFEPAPRDRLRPLLARRDLSWLSRRRLRVRERLLRDGQAVAVLGRGAREPDPDPAAAPAGYRATALRPVLRPGRRPPLYITDHVDS